MKRFIAATAVTLGLLSAATASAAPLYTSSVNFGSNSSVNFGNGTHDFSGVGSISWDQLFPTALTLPNSYGDITLTFYARHAIGNNDVVSINGVQVGALQAGNNSGNDSVATTFTLASSVYQAWVANNSPKLSLKFDYNAQGGQNKDAVTLESMMLTVNAPAGGAALANGTVPEPGTLALLGLAGALFASRKRQQQA